MCNVDCVMQQRYAVARHVIQRITPEPVITDEQNPPYGHGHSSISSQKFYRERVLSLKNFLGLLHDVSQSSNEVVPLVSVPMGSRLSPPARPQ